MEPSGRKLVCRRRVAMFQANPSENDQPSQETDGPSTSSSDSSQQVPSDSDVVPPSSRNQRNFSVPPEGTPVPTNIVKRAGPFLLGPTLGNSPVKSIVQCLARQEGTDDFYTLKILTLKGDGEVETQDERQGKMLLHTEYSLLSLLSNQEDVVHHHGFFKDIALEERLTSEGLVYTGKIRQRLCLVLDCLSAHDFSHRTADLINLQHYVIREKKLSEREAAIILYNTVKVVHSLHKRNIVHRDLKLGNLVLNQRTHKVTLTNFCLGKHLVSEEDLLKDQRGSPAYISPDVLCGKPYIGKPSDMWALGVVLFTMLYGQFPFYDSSPTQLFNKIKAADYTIPNDGRVSENTMSLIRRLLVLDPLLRLTAAEVLDSLCVTIAITKNLLAQLEPLQVVPDIDDDQEESQAVDSQPVPELDKNIDWLHKLSIPTNTQTQTQRRVGQIPVQRIGEDARELTAVDLARLRHMYPSGGRDRWWRPVVPQAHSSVGPIRPRLRHPSSQLSLRERTIVNNLSAIIQSRIEANTQH
ncbi:serine/threonine-protein kinase 40-like [Homalodisca vitripennis]|uniref:Serine/threonine-protein kinase 40 n=1 Tax=Homalodisca liturata TaxID=320908 RepID=A0A1B6K7A1_9HEMI|nr:serine/threonine-protein kinase 40-like [Homalodisca vitripennis]XP_046670076.1 serine/threonine-protein kinase 40-like [Homalodisca vitripennis]